MRTNVSSDYHTHSSHCPRCNSNFHPAEGCQCDDDEETPSQYMKRLQKQRSKAQKETSK